MKTTTHPNRVGRMAIALTIGLMSLSSIVISQIPTVITRLANPAYDCTTGQYCVDVQFQTNAPGVQLFGMNVRFFYDDTFMELDSFTDFQGGYAPVQPDPPNILMTAPGTGTTFFGFPAPGIADFVNGAVQLVDITQPPIYIYQPLAGRNFSRCVSQFKEIFWTVPTIALLSYGILKLILLSVDISRVMMV